MVGVGNRRIMSAEARVCSATREMGKRESSSELNECRCVDCAREQGNTQHCVHVEARIDAQTVGVVYSVAVCALKCELLHDQEHAGNSHFT